VQIKDESDYSSNNSLSLSSLKNLHSLLTSTQNAAGLYHRQIFPVARSHG
jgi:hypothetical protein